MSTPTSVTDPVGVAQQPPPRRRYFMRVARVALAAAALIFVVLAVADRWHDVRHQLGLVNPATVVLAGLAVLAATLAGMMSWRAVLADLGSPLPVLPAAQQHGVARLVATVAPSLASHLPTRMLREDAAGLIAAFRRTGRPDAAARLSEILAHVVEESQDGGPGHG